ncbi:SUF system NifU family Fe-S cluster assembly protein [Arthrobacter echini]|uniref:SUF system NifU family Fe-S cluster assembly protein n=1 Tax=Arthrobacter echini TaxID=1529066 RepID=A0A4S5E8J6_9MICC|nr:SUF system NifU family Fe-S cluster assembly protein [Arthrobacter echini]THJ67833.1 SUF system NifU family Fe-S cluster assembly protein [Arthrobacter echini]
MSSDLEQLYQQIILDHARARHGSPLRDDDGGGEVRYGESHQLNPVCGDEITLRAGVAGGTVTSVSWDGAGCAISMASASVLTDLMQGLSRDEVMPLVDTFRDVLRSRGRVQADEEVLGDAAAFAGVSRFPARVKCAMLAWVALEESLLASNA